MIVTPPSTFFTILFDRTAKEAKDSKTGSEA